MKIIICDDNARELERLKSTIKTYMDTKNRPSIILSYENSKELDFDLEDKAQGDLYILDIDMPGLSGIEIAEKVKNLYPHAILFFFTSHAEYATSGYRMEVRRYILKDQSKEDLCEALDFAWDTFNRQKKDGIPVFSAGKTFYIPVSEILYIDRLGRNCVVHTMYDGDLVDRSSIKAISERLHGSEFLFIDKSILINIDYVNRIEGDQIVMTNGSIFVISRRRMKEVKSRILEHWTI